MHRAQIILEDWQYQRLRSLSASRRQSISELVREILAEHLGASPSGDSRAALAAIEGIGSDPQLCAREHDEVLYGKPKGRR